MKEIIADLRGINDADTDEIADHPARAELESMLHIYAGKVIRIRITVCKKLAYINNKER